MTTGSSSSWVADPFTPQLPQFLLQVTLIVVIVRIVGRLLTKINQPMVIGEIIAGILLGPSVMGFIPNFSETVFTPSSLPYLKLFADVGLIFFMFFLGMEVEPRLMRKTWKTSLPIAFAAIAVPFGSGIGLATWLVQTNDDDKFQAQQAAAAKGTTIPMNNNDLAFYLFFGTSMSFTAFPVLARILTSARLITSPLGIETLATAAIDDLLAWCTLATVLSYSSGGSGINGLYVVLTAMGFVLFLAFPVRLFLNSWHAQLVEREDELNRNFIAFLFLCLSISSWFTAIIGIEAFFGAFVFGMVVPKSGNLINDLAPRIELLIVEFFLPLYFASSGLKTDISKLNTGMLWGMTIAITAVSIAAKTMPVTLLARLFDRKKTWKHCLAMGVLMDTRGLVALIVMNIGLSLGILGTKVFTMLVLMCLITTFLSPPLVHRLYAIEYYEQQALKQQAERKISHADKERGVLMNEGENGVMADLHAVPPNARQASGTMSERSVKSMNGILIHDEKAGAGGTMTVPPGSEIELMSDLPNISRAATVPAPSHPDRQKTRSRWHFAIQYAINDDDRNLEQEDAYLADGALPRPTSRENSRVRYSQFQTANQPVNNQTSPLTHSQRGLSELDIDQPDYTSLNIPPSARSGLQLRTPQSHATGVGVTPSSQTGRAFFGFHTRDHASPATHQPQIIEEDTPPPTADSNESMSPLPHTFAQHRDRQPSVSRNSADINNHNDNDDRNHEDNQTTTSDTVSNSESINTNDSETAYLQPSGNGTSSMSIRQRKS